MQLQQRFSTYEFCIYLLKIKKSAVCFLKKNKRKNDARSIDLKKSKKIDNWSRLTTTIEFLIGKPTNKVTSNYIEKLTIKCS